MPVQLRVTKLRAQDGKSAKVQKPSGVVCQNDTASMTLLSSDTSSNHVDFGRKLVRGSRVMSRISRVSKRSEYTHSFTLGHRKCHAAQRCLKRSIKQRKMAKLACPQPRTLTVNPNDSNKSCNCCSASSSAPSRAARPGRTRTPGALRERSSPT